MTGEITAGGEDCEDWISFWVFYMSKARGDAILSSSKWINQIKYCRKMKEEKRQTNRETLINFWCF